MRVAAVRSGSGRVCVKAATTNNHQKDATRRQALLSVGAIPLLLIPAPSHAVNERLRLNKEADPESSPLIQELLARSKANKEQYDKERLDDYYRRNYKDYFDFEAGNIQRGGAKGLSEDTKKGILEWLEKNK